MKILSRDRPNSYWNKKARENNIPHSTYYDRIQRGWTREQAATRAVASSIQRDENSEYRQAELAGLNSSAVSNYRSRHRDYATPTKDIIKHLLNHKSKESIITQAEKVGLKPSVVYSRLNRGWSREAALTNTRSQT